MCVYCKIYFFIVEQPPIIVKEERKMVRKGEHFTLSFAIGKCPRCTDQLMYIPPTKNGVYLPDQWVKDEKLDTMELHRVGGEVT